MSNRPTFGDTIHFKCEFKDALGDPVNVDESTVTLNIYDVQKEQIGNVIDTGFDNSATGVFEYDWTVPDAGDDMAFIYYEFGGTHPTEDYPIIERGRLRPSFSSTL